MVAKGNHQPVDRNTALRLWCTHGCHTTSICYPPPSHVTSGVDFYRASFRSCTEDSYSIRLTDLDADGYDDADVRSRLTIVPRYADPDPSQQFATSFGC